MTSVTTYVKNNYTLAGMTTANMFMWMIICRVLMRPHRRAIETERNIARKRLITNVTFKVVSEYEPTLSSMMIGTI